MELKVVVHDGSGGPGVSEPCERLSCIIILFSALFSFDKDRPYGHIGLKLITRFL